MAATFGRTPPGNRQRGTLLPQRSHRISSIMDAPAPFNIPGSLPPAPMSRGEAVLGHPFGTPPRVPPFSNLSSSRGSLRSPPGLASSGNRARWTATDESLSGESASEWSMSGLDVPLLKLAHLVVEEQSDLGEAGDSSAGGLRPFSALGSSQIAAYSWGGDPPRWNLEIVRNTSSSRQAAAPSDSLHDPLLAPLPAATGGLSIYLTCHLLDRDYASSLTIPVSILLGIRDKRAKTTSDDRWLWRTWKEHEFGPDNEFWQCLDMPEPMALLAERGNLTSLEHLVLTLQISSPTGQSGPEFREATVVPQALLGGLRNLFDDPSTGDILISCSEMLIPPASPSGSVDLAAPSASQGALYRRRVIYAHTAILRARSGYFSAMLTDHWAEAGETVAGRRRHRLTISDFSFDTVWAVINWLYSDEIRFAEQEDARKVLNEDLPEGALGNGAHSIGWQWQPLTATGRASPVQVRLPSAQGHRTSLRNAKGAEEEATPLVPPTSPGAKQVAPADPHPHPASAPAPTSALDVYRLAHRCELTMLANIALEHIVQSLTPRTAFALLLATELWPELHSAIQRYTLDIWPTILETQREELQRCFQEVSEGRWERGGETLFEFTQQLSLQLGLRGTGQDVA